MSDLFFGTFSVIGKGRPKHPLRFYKPIYTRKERGIIILYYKGNQCPNLLKSKS